MILAAFFSAGSGGVEIGLYLINVTMPKLPITVRCCQHCANADQSIGASERLMSSMDLTSTDGIPTRRAPSTFSSESSKNRTRSGATPIWRATARYVSGSGFRRASPQDVNTPEKLSNKSEKRLEKTA